MASKIITFTLNGRETEIIAKPMVTLQAVLRQQLNRTATKSGCNQGGCGSCTVLVDGEPMVSCLLPVADVDGRSITTLEGLGTNDKPHPLHQ
jgi:aerobic-type carbon monoxide dehydrogenase small subunit (CoxS/CutS family)